MDLRWSVMAGPPPQKTGHNVRMSLGGIARFALQRITGGAPMLKVGDQAPDFDVTDHQGKRTKLSDFRGKKVVLWFYPKASTPG